MEDSVQFSKRKTNILHHCPDVNESFRSQLSDGHLQLPSFWNQSHSRWLEEKISGCNSVSFTNTELKSGMAAAESLSHDITLNTTIHQCDKGRDVCFRMIYNNGNLTHDLRIIFWNTFQGTFKDSKLNEWENTELSISVDLCTWCSNSHVKTSTPSVFLLRDVQTLQCKLFLSVWYSYGIFNNMNWPHLSSNVSDLSQINNNSNAAVMLLYIFLLNVNTPVYLALVWNMSRNSLAANV